MDISYLVFLPIFFALIVIGVFWIIIQKPVKGNNVLKLNESEINWEEIKCPKCQIPLDLPLRGVSSVTHYLLQPNVPLQLPGIYLKLAPGSRPGNRCVSLGR